MRRQYIIFLLLIALVSVLFFVISGSMINSKINKINSVDKKIKKAQEKLNSAKIMNEQLSQFNLIINNSLTTEKQFSPDEVNAFVKQLADMCDQYKIAVVSIYPKAVFSNASMLEQQYILELNCTYVQTGQFLSELEGMDNIIKINTLDVTPVQVQDANSKTLTASTQVTRYKVTLELSIFKVVKEA
ncbi:MAG TPA: type 4a pilus biogenesis protein PilO [Candidatus Cloacimonadota bacterium]|nr:type 4a pilus biogenesis protein PilO [Candidatus Cloacimonadota bacterium]HPT70685.1 type 4a pilus biogenesis protein PilO [Candidatus Cloacimonadota bacterium]